MFRRVSFRAVGRFRFSTRTFRTRRDIRRSFRRRLWLTPAVRGIEASIRRGTNREGEISLAYNNRARCPSAMFIYDAPFLLFSTARNFSKFSRPSTRENRECSVYSLERELYVFYELLAKHVESRVYSVSGIGKLSRD